MVWTLLNPTEFAQKIDLLLKVPDVALSTAENMTSLQIQGESYVPVRQTEAVVRLLMRLLLIFLHKSKVDGLKKFVKYVVLFFRFDIF